MLLTGIIYALNVAIVHTNDLVVEVRQMTHLCDRCVLCGDCPNEMRGRKQSIEHGMKFTADGDVSGCPEYILKGSQYTEKQRELILCTTRNECKIGDCKTCGRKEGKMPGSHNLVDLIDEIFTEFWPDASDRVSKEDIERWLREKGIDPALEVIP